MTPPGDIATRQVVVQRAVAGLFSQLTQDGMSRRARHLEHGRAAPRDGRVAVTVPCRHSL